MTYISSSNDPYINLSIEEALFEGYSGGEPLVYLWVNRPCVVIGRNQNIWRECRLDQMERDGVLPVRRDTGGGAVYHDEGTLLFSCIMPADTGTDGSYGLITSALADLGARVELRGRNDLVCADGRKVSGSAYINSRGKLLHHGTLLISADLGRLERYLTPSRAKLAAKGVASARARVANLSESCPGLSVSAVSAAIIARCGAAVDARSYVDMGAVERRAAERRAWDFLYGATPPFELALETRLPMGEIQLHIAFRHGRAETVRVFGDMLDPTLPAALERALTGCAMDAAALATAAARVSGEAAEWLAQVRV